MLSLLANHGNLDELRARADVGDWHAAMQHAAMQLASLLVRRADLDELRARADARDKYAAEHLSGLLTKSALSGIIATNLYYCNRPPGRAGPGALSGQGTALLTGSRHVQR